MMREYRILLLLLLVWGVGGITQSCNEDKRNSGSEGIPESIEVRPDIIMAIADSLPITQRIETEGVIESGEQLNIVSRESGFLIDHQLKDGKIIQKGDLIFQFDTRDIDVQIKEAETALRKANETMLVEFRIRSNGKTAVPDSILERLKIQYGVTEAGLRLDALKLRRNYMRLTAPFSGQIYIPKIINRGDYISAGMVLGTLINRGKLVVQLFVLQEEAAKIRIGRKVVINHGEHQAIVTAISPMVDQEKQTVSVWAEVLNHNKIGLLRKGERVQVFIELEDIYGQVRVPRSAVLERDNRFLVFKNESGIAKWVYVLPIAMNRDWAIVQGKDTPLIPGDTIAIDRHFTLSHLQKITPKL